MDTVYKTRRKVLFALVVLLALVPLVAYLFHLGLLRFNYPSRERYPVWGIDVSHHQGVIDWSAAKGSGVQFVFIKATEGGDFKDSRFQTNWRDSRKVGLPRGAYHFFTFCRSGLQQAENLITTLPPAQDMLPPVANIEFGGNCAQPPSATKIRLELKTFLHEVEEAYEMKPILYVTTDAYKRIVEGHFNGYRLWVRDIFFHPRLPGDVEWTFWQYANRGRIDGISGPVDLNVFHSDHTAFARL